MRVRTIGLNGKDAALEAIGGKIARQILSVSNRNWPYIAVIDREKRNDSASVIRDKLRSQIVNSELVDVKEEQLIVGVADRSIENWIASDWEGCGLACPPKNSYDGCFIIGKLRECNPKYKKVIDGVKLAKRADWNRVYQRSASFREFADAVHQHGMLVEYLQGQITQHIVFSEATLSEPEPRM